LDDYVAVGPAAERKEILIHQDGVEKPAEIAGVKSVAEARAGAIGAMHCDCIVADQAQIPTSVGRPNLQVFNRVLRPYVVLDLNHASFGSLPEGGPVEKYCTL